MRSIFTPPSSAETPIQNLMHSHHTTDRFRESDGSLTPAPRYPDGTDKHSATPGLRDGAVKHITRDGGRSWDLQDLTGVDLIRVADVIRLLQCLDSHAELGGNSSQIISRLDGIGLLRS